MNNPLCKLLYTLTMLIAATAIARAQTPPQAIGPGHGAAAKQAERYAPIKKQDDPEPVPELELFTGESRVFPTPGVARIAVGNGQVITANALDDKDVIIFANGAGSSTLFVWNQDGRFQRVKVTVLPADMGRYAREVATFLATIPKARATVVGDKVVVEGDELSDADRDKVAELAKRYPLIVNFTSPIGWEQMVMMDVKVVEFPKTELRELGLKWSATGGAAIGGIWAPSSRGDVGGYAITVRTGDANAPPITVPSGGSGGSGGFVPLPSNLTILSAINLGLNAQLLALEQKGTASVLAEPQLSTRSGYKASFLAGGEIPYSVASINGVTVQFKPYGVKLEIEPKVGSNGVIRAVIESEVSSIDASLSTASGPALLTRRTKTEFNVRRGETIVLSGLLQRNSSTDIDKVPLLGDIPILGALFRSKRFQNKETELVVFVTPSVVDSHSAGLVDRTQRAGERLEHHLGRPPYLSNPLQPGADAAGFNQAPPVAAPVH
ncbi:MAG: pilus assembly protein N-terminal domain-containing protein [Pseudomonadota bacterium]